MQASVKVLLEIYNSSKCFSLCETFGCYFCCETIPSALSVIGATSRIGKRPIYVFFSLILLCGYFFLKYPNISEAEEAFLSKCIYCQEVLNIINLEHHIRTQIQSCLLGLKLTWLEIRTLGITSWISLTIMHRDLHNQNPLQSPPFLKLQIVQTAPQPSACYFSSYVETFNWKYLCKPFSFFQFPLLSIAPLPISLMPTTSTG